MPDVTAPLLRVVVPLDVALVVTTDVAGESLEIEADGFEGTVHFPRYSPNEEAVLAPAGFERSPAAWGGRNAEISGSVQIGIEALAFTFPLDASSVHIPVDASSVHIPADELSQGYAKGVEPIREAAIEWVRRLAEFAMAVLRQPLTLEDPSPKNLSPATANAQTWLEAEGTQSWIDTSPGTITIITEATAGPWSERAGDLPSVERLVRLASEKTAVPSAIALVTAARTAAHRGRWRLALMEMGTCLEAVLTTRLPPLPKGYETLGPMTKRALAAGVPLPSDVGTVFVKPRNDAVHNGLDPSSTTVTAALGFLDPLVASDHPEFACDESLPLAHRPQRFDLSIVQPAFAAAEIDQAGTSPEMQQGLLDRLNGPFEDCGDASPRGAARLEGPVRPGQRG